MPQEYSIHSRTGGQETQKSLEVVYRMQHRYFHLQLILREHVFCSIAPERDSIIVRYLVCVLFSIVLLIGEYRSRPIALLFFQSSYSAGRRG
jgi:hypothetical protein